TGHPWITFKDPCNLRSPQQHTGVVHSSNLCTEITLNTSDDEIAVCNLGSINLLAHMTASGLDFSKIKTTISVAMRMLDNVIAIAPTATIANIVGVSASIEPTYQNLFVKSNLSGEFTVVNEFLVRDLKQAGLWDEVMIADLKYFDGNLARIDRVPAELRRLYATAFETEPKWLVEAAARRQKWIDQSQSLNIYMPGASGKKLDDTYKLAWIRGLKTTYYLLAMGAAHAEKSTSKAGALNAVPSATASGDMSAEAGV